jgi:hypothetical protein
MQRRGKHGVPGGPSAVNASLTNRGLRRGRVPNTLIPSEFHGKTSLWQSALGSRGAWMRHGRLPADSIAARSGHQALGAEMKVRVI